MWLSGTKVIQKAFKLNKVIQKRVTLKNKRYTVCLSEKKVIQMTVN